MIVLAAVAAAMLLAAGLYLLLSSNVQLLVIGFLLLSNGVNLLVITASGLPVGAAPPLIRDATAQRPMVDPLPQAFLLTATVIGLGMAAFLIAMAVRFHRESGSDDPGRE
jgi:multicomponent Na+:H+ antiporter subunit C